MKRFFASIFFLTVGVFLLGSVFYVVGGGAIWGLLLGFNLWGLVPIVLLTILSALCAIWRWHFIIQARGFNISFFQLLPIWLAANGFSYITPIVYVGGEGVKAFLLRDKFKVPLSRSITFIALEKILEFTAVFFFLIAGVGIFILHKGGLPDITKTIVVAVGVVLGVAFFVLILYIQAFRNRKFIAPLVQFFSLENTRFGLALKETEEEMIDFLDLRSPAMWYSWALSFLRHMFFLMRTILLVYYLGQGLQIAASLSALAGLYASYALPIPAAIGAQEISQSFVLAQFGWGPGIGTALSFLIRGADILIVVVGLIFLFRFGIDLMASKILHRIKLNYS